MIEKICPKCKKPFKCNKGCASIKLDHYKVKYGGCYCPDCAKVFEEIEGRPYPKDLKEVCSRFIDCKEVVTFT